MTDERIGNLLASVPRRSLILIEDVDAFFTARTKADAQVRISYSGFINALDGVAAHEGSVVFLTTNHPHLIDEAAIRSGRVDVRLELGLCDRSQLERMFAKFHDDPAAIARFADTVAPNCWSPAQVQEALLKAVSVDEAIEHFKSREREVKVLKAA